MKTGPLLGSFEALARYFSIKSDGSALDAVEDFVQPTIDVIRFNSLMLEITNTAVAGASVPAVGSGALLTGAGGGNGNVRMGPPAGTTEIWLIHGASILATAAATSMLGVQVVVATDAVNFTSAAVGPEACTSMTGSAHATLPQSVKTGVLYTSSDPLVLLPGMTLGYIVTKKDVTGGVVSFNLEMLYRKYNAS